MQPSTHFAAGLFFGLAVVTYFGQSYWWALAAAFIAMFVDIDHGIAYFLHYHKFSIKGCFNACCGHMFPGGRMFIHHKNGFLAITTTLIVMYVVNPFIAVLIGVAYYSHYILDHRIFNPHIKGFDDYTIHTRPFGYLYDLSWREVLIELALWIGSAWFLLPKLWEII
jgi:hypothetical protein